ncbi:MAG: Ig-like domain-containing protein, partial [Treponema sp.]|nr:Ig-like domain-containing protein [Treponema sp.]
MKKKSGLRKSLFFVGLGILALVFMGCETWLSGKNFFGTVEQEVKYANAEEIPVYVRYAARTMGDTSPNGRATEKVDIPFDVTAVDDTAYQFYMWAAFSTDDYPTSRQYNNLLMLNSIEEFNTEYADKLLPPSEVWFEDALSSSTKAKVINKREDVFIIPICVKRATVEQSIPKNNEENAVKNTGITIVFSRSMDKSKLINDNNTYNQEYITIQRRTGSGESVGYIDYSEYFDKATLSASGKTLTIRQRPETTGSSPDGSKMLPAGVTILVTISKDASDVLGVEMESDVKISFHTSNSTDTGAPVIEGIGIGYTTLSNAFESTSSNANTYKGTRVKDKANIWAIANDPTSPGGTGSGEGNVYELYYSIDGENVDSYNLQGYASGEYNFEPPVESDPASLLSQGGVGFSVDVSSYADGLRHLRIYGTDLYTNSGYPTYVSDAWFVKDTQAPSTENAGRIETECTTAPNGWYNENSLGQMKIKGTGIVDSPEDNENLRSPKVWWNLMTDGSTTPSAGGTGWSEVSTTAKSLRNELGITLSASTADPTTGVLPMYVSFKDDLGNVSAPTAISSLRYDNDKPVLGTMVWENASGAEILPFSNQALLDTQILRIPFTEALSGVKKLTIWRTTGSASGSVASGNALGNAGMKISYRSADSTTKTVLASGTDYTVDFDSSTNKATVTFASDTSNYAKKTGFFYIENLLSTDQETTVFHVEVEDSAINKCATAATKAIVCDLADPEVKEAKFLDTNDDEHAVKVEYFGQASGTERYYLSGDTATFNATGATKIPLRLAIKESGSGVKKIKFTGDIKISASTQVYVGAAKTL